MILLPIAFALLAVNSVFCFNNSTERNVTSSAVRTTDVVDGREAVFEEGGCDFDVDFCDWTNEVGRDDFNWTRRKEKTPSSSTGPNKDRSGVGYYIYAETSWPRKSGERTRLVGGPFQE
ncbi:hypothetical protein OS493_033423 [Desmophyllum pertusum]|uniref:MAM domain-containing protein n=1 Tax=Desmophyllum pertusum TaxID=174260 RepID=A0A9W9ZWM7_9CNID|nr:hypothetical protein OS493_033423 [Desmophyllum pertusum]